MGLVWQTLAQTATQKALTPEKRAALQALTHHFVILILLLTVVLVLLIVVLRRHYVRALKSLRAPRKPTEVEDLWFENPIERGGEEAAPSPPPSDQESTTE